MGEAQAGVVKNCCTCGKDVSRTRRIKDAKGRYWCDPCYESAKQPKTSPEPAQVAATPTDDAGVDLAALAQAEQAASGELRVLPELSPIAIEGGAPERKLRKGAAPQNLISRPCVQCKYDLKGLDMHCTCPECGTRNGPPKLAKTRDKLKEEREIARSFYLKPLKLTLAGLGLMILIRLITPSLTSIPMTDSMLAGVGHIIMIVLAVPASFIGYFIFQKVFGQPADAEWYMQLAHLAAAFSLIAPVEALVDMTPIAGGLIAVSKSVLFALILYFLLDLEDWKDGIILSIIMSISSFVCLIIAVAAVEMIFA